MKLKPLSLLLLLAAALASCSLLGPEYRQPASNTPAEWASGGKIARMESADLADLAWWKKFNDPQLNHLIESGLAENNNIQVAMGNLLQAQASLHQVQMNWLPTLSLSGVGLVGQTFNPGFENTSPYPALNHFTPQNSSSFSGYGAGFMPSYTLNVFSQIKKGEIAKLNLALQQQALNAVRLGVISQIAGSYFSLLGTQHQLELEQALIQDAIEMRQYNRLKYNSGSISDFNLQGIDQYIAELTAKIPAIGNDLTQIQNALQVLLNQNPGKIVTTNNFAKLSLDGIIPLNLPSQVLKTRPDLQMAEYQLKLANANIGAVTAQFFPTINLTGMLGQGSLQLTNLFNAGGDFWLGQLGAGIPLLNLSLYAEIDKAKGNYYSAYYGYIQTVRNAFAQVDNGLSRQNSLSTAASAQQLALAKAAEMYQYSQKQYQAGALSYADTLGFKLNMDYAAIALNQVKVQQINSLVNLYQVLGGGYNAESQLAQAKKFNDSHDINN